MNRLIILSLALLCSCASQRFASTSRGRTDSAATDRIVLYNAEVTLLVPEPDTLNKQLLELARKYQGYAVKVGDMRSTIRIPSPQLDNALADLATFGKMRAHSVSGEDITEEYKDYRIRLDNAEKARLRYLQLLEKAENVEATVKVEKELERLTVEIDMLKGKLARFDHLAAFSTIAVNIEKKHKLGPLGHVTVGVYKSVKWLLCDRKEFRVAAPLEATNIRHAVEILRQSTIRNPQFLEKRHFA